MKTYNIDFDKNNNSEENLIALCHSCHIQTNWGREEWKQYYQNKIKGEI